MGIKQLNPAKTLNSEVFIAYEKATNNERRLKAVLNLIIKSNLRICGVGGASGIFLNELLNKSKYKIQLFNLEIDKDYQNKQKNKNISFINNSITDNKIKDNFFDIVTFNQVLHHLASNSPKNTLYLQKNVLEEIFRITKKGGHIIFEEEVYSSTLISRITYFISKFSNYLSNQLNINFNYLSLGKVVVSFMTKEEIGKIIEENREKYNLKTVEFKYTKWNLPLKYRGHTFGSEVGIMLYIINK